MSAFDQRKIIAILSIAGLMLTGSWSLATAQEEESHRVLILRFDNSIQPGPSITQSHLIRGIREKLTKKIIFDVEYLDLHRFGDQQHQRNLIDLLEHKYARIKFDLLVVIGINALELLINNEIQLFEDTPVVFVLMQPHLPENFRKLNNITGLISSGPQNSIKKTMELPLILRPDSRKLIIIAGVDKWSRNLLKIAKEAAQQYEKQVEFSWLTDQTMDELIKAVSAPINNMSIVYLSVIKDAAGNDFIPVEACRMIAQASKAPVYALWSSTIGIGATGGYVLSGQKIGAKAADLCVRILNGEKVSNIPIDRYEEAYMFDWRQLKRWSIIEDQLPPGSIVKFKETTIWARYKGRIIGAIAIIIFQALIIVYLIRQRRIRRLTEEELLQAEQKYRTVADYTYDWEYWSNIDGSLEYVSPSCERISGYSVQDFKENPALFREIIVHEDKKSWEAHDLKSERELKPGELQFRIQRKDGQIRWIEHVCQPVKNLQGAPLGFRASNRDITDRKQAELDAHRHRSELTHISRIATLGELSASLAHELNQPLTAILSNAQAARRFLTGDRADPDEVNEILIDIIKDDKRAADLINRLRALMKKRELEFTSLDLNKVIRGVAELANREAFTKDVSLVLELADALPQVRGDAIHLEQVILNLILNGTEAIANLDHQSRELRILTANHDENAVRVSVRDKGTGINEGDITNIFEAFYTTKPEGMGMGLSICRSIIEAHGGRLWAKNNPDQGATISFTVPISRGHQA